MIETTLSPALNWGLFAVIGLAAGVICGMLGVGGGSVMVPALVLLACYSQKSAQGTALAVMIPMAFVSVVRYKLNPEVSMDGIAIGLLIATGVVGALIGAELAARVPGPILKKIFAIFLIIAAFKMLFSPKNTTPGDMNTGGKNENRSMHAGLERG